jgi:hypothetical protein
MLMSTNNENAIWFEDIDLQSAYSIDHLELLASHPSLYYHNNKLIHVGCKWDTMNQHNY